MEWDYLSVGPCPAEEDAAQLGQAGFDEANRRETKAFIEAIRRKCGPEPEGAMLMVKTERGSDFGNYREVNVKFDASNADALDYAYRCEREAPTTWAEVNITPEEVKRGSWKPMHQEIER